MSSKFEVVRAQSGGCSLCTKNDRELYVARESNSGQLRALCSHCLLNNLEHYVIDNTRPWPVLDGYGVDRREEA